MVRAAGTIAAGYLSRASGNVASLVWSVRDCETGPEIFNTEATEHTEQSHAFLCALCGLVSLFYPLSF